MVFLQKKRKMIVFPKAKINLGLRIVRKRPDGYHDIETLFYPVNLSDALEFVVSGETLDKDTLTVTGITIGGDPEENLVIKTLKKLREYFSFPYLKVHLHKVIPAGAGLGGGSSDAAFLLKAVKKSFELTIDDNHLKAIALELGSDCPFFIDSHPAFASGRGEVLIPARPVLSGYYILLLNPGVVINTREAYQNCLPSEPPGSLLRLTERSVKKWKELIINDFEVYAFKEYPLLGNIKNELYNSGALFSSMSGSGSTIYGIFSEKPEIPAKLKDFVIWEEIL
jgi:4-diphosphocytidyl-2-C-methyl-D-erythritol kinase